MDKEQIKKRVDEGDEKNPKGLPSISDLEFNEMLKDIISAFDDEPIKKPHLPKYHE